MLTIASAADCTSLLQVGLGFFCVVFAVNSAVHSYLVLRYAEGNRAAVTVGFYYCSNAAGRLLGTLMSGVLYTYAGATRTDGFGWCFVLRGVPRGMHLFNAIHTRTTRMDLHGGAFMLVKRPLPAGADSGQDTAAPPVRCFSCAFDSSAYKRCASHSHHHVFAAAA